MRLCRVSPLISPPSSIAMVGRKSGGPRYVFPSMQNREVRMLEDRPSFQVAKMYLDEYQDVLT